MEKETYKTAKDLLEKYDPNSELVQVSPVLRTLRQSDIHSGCFKSSSIYISSRQIVICPTLKKLLSLSLPKANLTKPRKFLNPEPSNET